MHTNILKMGTQRMGPVSFQRCPVTGCRTTGENEMQEVPTSEDGEKLL